MRVSLLVDWGRAMRGSLLVDWGRAMRGGHSLLIGGGAMYGGVTPC